jgi:hypothetical protein
MYYEQVRTNIMHKISMAKNQFLILSYLLALQGYLQGEKKNIRGDTKVIFKEKE